MKRPNAASFDHRPPPVRLFLRTASVALLLSVAHQSALQGSQIAYEPFSYSSGSPVAGDGSSDNVGFSDNWYGDGSYTITSGSVPSPVGLPESGNSVNAPVYGANRNLSRDLSAPLGANNTTAYFSWVIEPEGTVGAGAFNGWFAFDLIGGGGGRQLNVGKDMSHGTYSLQDNVGDQPVETNVQVISGQPHLFVLADDFLPGNDIYQLYIDPPAGQLQPATAAATMNFFDLGSVTTVGFTGPGANDFDELRVGNTWASVTSVPEPGSIVLALVGVTACASCESVGKKKGRESLFGPRMSIFEQRGRLVCLSLDAHPLPASLERGDARFKRLLLEADRLHRRLNPPLESLAANEAGWMREAVTKAIATIKGRQRSEQMNQPIASIELS